MSLLRRSRNEEQPIPEAQPAHEEEVLQFTIAKRGYDPEEVTQYVQQLLNEHEQDLDLVQERLMAAQAETQRTEDQMAQRINDLVAQLNAARETVHANQANVPSAADLEREASLVEARGRIAQLEIELQEALAGAGQVILAGPSSEEAREALAERDQARGRLAELETELGELHAQLDEARADREAPAAAVELASLRSQLADAQAELDAQRELAAKLSDAEQTIDALRGELKLARESGDVDSQQLAAQLEVAREQAERQFESVRGLEAEVAEARARHEAQLAHQDGLQERLDSAEREAAQFSAERDAIRDHATELQTRIGELESELSEQRQLLADSQRELLEINATHAVSGHQLQQAQDSAEHAQRRAEQLQVQLDQLRLDYSETVREAAKAGARADLLEQELTQLRTQQDDFGDSARRMMQALKENREQQERELASERERVMAEISHLHAAAREEADQLRLQAMQAVVAAETERQSIADASRARAREVVNALQHEIADLARSSETRVEAARASEQQIRDAVKQAAALDLEALGEERDALLHDIEQLQDRRAEMQQLALGGAVPAPAPPASPPVTPAPVAAPPAPEPAPIIEPAPAVAPEDAEEEPTPIKPVSAPVEPAAPAGPPLPSEADMAAWGAPVERDRPPVAAVEPLDLPSFAPAEAMRAALAHGPSEPVLPVAAPPAPVAVERLDLPAPQELGAPPAAPAAPIAPLNLPSIEQAQASSPAAPASVSPLDLPSPGGPPAPLDLPPVVLDDIEDLPAPDLTAPSVVDVASIAPPAEAHRIHPPAPGPPPIAPPPIAPSGPVITEEVD